MSGTAPVSSNHQVISCCKLDTLVSMLNELRRTATLDHSLRIGRLIVTEIYGGDLASWRKHREKEFSFRQLAARTQVDLKMSVTSIYRAVALYELCSRVPVELWRDFGAGHLRAVLGLLESDQLRLLSLAKANQWTARELYSRAQEVQGRTPKARPSRSALDGVKRRLFAQLQAFESAALRSDSIAVHALIREVRNVLDRLETVGSSVAGPNLGTSKRRDLRDVENVPHAP